MANNFFEIPDQLPKDFELFNSVFANEKIQIERIVSSGQSTPEGQWLEDDRNEWVILLEGESEIKFEDQKVHILSKGDHLYIPKNTKHRVVRTSTDPYCIWLAVYFE